MDRRLAESGTVMTTTVKGRSLVWSGVDIIRLRGDKISELQSYWDTQRLNAAVKAALL